MRIRTIALLLLLTGCESNSQVQMAYIEDRNECQAEAQARSLSSVASGNRDSVLKTNFARCMRNDGWKLSTAKAPTTAGQPISTPSGTGVSPQTTAARTSQPAAATTTATQPAAATTAQPASAAAATTPPAATYQPVQNTIPQGASTYQPVGGVSGGISPGRDFTGQ